MQLFTGAWWRAAGIRAAHQGWQTALALILPVLAALAGADWVVIVSTTAGSVVASFVISLVSLPEAADGLPWWKALLLRVVRTAANVIAAALPVGLFMVHTLNWAGIGRTAGIACVLAVLKAYGIGLPETTAGPAVIEDPAVANSGPVDYVPQGKAMYPDPLADAAPSDYSD